MADDYIDAVRQALSDSGDLLRNNLGHRSPGILSSRSWKDSVLTDRVRIRSRDMGAVMTQTNKRHPVFPDSRPRKEWAWADENKNDPARTGWADRAVDEVFDDAGNKFLDTYLGVIAQNSEYLHR